MSARPQFSGESLDCLTDVVYRVVPAPRLTVTFPSFVAMILLIIANVNTLFQHVLTVFPTVHSRSRKSTHPTFRGHLRW